MNKKNIGTHIHSSYTFLLRPRQFLQPCRHHFQPLLRIFSTITKTKGEISTLTSPVYLSKFTLSLLFSQLCFVRFLKKHIRRNHKNYSKSYGKCFQKKPSQMRPIHENHFFNFELHIKSVNRWTIDIISLETIENVTIRFLMIHKNMPFDWMNWKWLTKRIRFDTDTQNWARNAINNEISSKPRKKGRKITYNHNNHMIETVWYLMFEVLTFDV